MLSGAEALDGVEHETEVSRVGFGDADDKGFGGAGGAPEDGADPSAGTDIAEEGVRGVAIRVDGREGVFEKGDLDEEVSGHMWRT